LEAPPPQPPGRCPSLPPHLPPLPRGRRRWWQPGVGLIHHDAAGQETRRRGGNRVAGASQRLRTAAAYDSLQAGLERLRSDGWLIVQTAAAAAIAWLLAAAGLHPQQRGVGPPRGG